MGSWTFVEPRIAAVMAMVGRGSQRPRYAGRAASAATATGLMSKHEAQRQQFLEEALGD
jgi:2-oxoglutarate dehydrogenase E1 component